MLDDESLNKSFSCICDTKCHILKILIRNNLQDLGINWMERSRELCIKYNTQDTGLRNRQEGGEIVIGQKKNVR